ncbi:MAG: hypothetical protein IT260_13240, partial [Saprospiraceae bacterium]|nr:hypothetical protein [Saprospiraceae bacterium]
MELANFLLLQQKLTQLELPQGFEPGEVEAGLAQRYFGESSALLIEYQIFSLLRSPETTPEAFHQLADLLQQHQADIKKDRLEQYYSYLRNFCVLLIQSGAEYLLPVLHRLHRENLEHGFLYHAHENHLKLPPSSLLNMITVAIRVGKVDWACALLESHKDRIIGDNESRDLYRLNLACCLFASGQPDEALSNIPPNSPYADYHLSARRLEIKIYYEQASELLPYKVDAFKMFISRASQKFLSAQLRQ